jgi:hypothetical protein
MASKQGIATRNAMAAEISSLREQLQAAEKEIERLGNKCTELAQFPLTVIVASSTLSTGVGPYGLSVYGPFGAWNEAVEWARGNLNRPGQGYIVEWQAVRVYAPFMWQVEPSR